MKRIIVFLVGCLTAVEALPHRVHRAPRVAAPVVTSPVVTPSMPGIIAAPLIAPFFAPPSPPLVVVQNSPIVIGPTVQSATHKRITDPIESVLRYLFSTVLYNPTAKKFATDPLVQLKAKLPPNTPNALDALINFYTKNTVESVNKADPALRGAWNEIVRGLNTVEPGAVRYRRATQLDAGLVNLVRAFATLLGVSLADLPVNLPEKTKWIQDRFADCLKALDGSKGYVVNLEKARTVGEEVFGDLSITIQPVGGQAVTFKYTAKQVR